MNYTAFITQVNKMELSAIKTKKDGFKKLILTVYVETILPVAKILDYPIQN